MVHRIGFGCVNPGCGGETRTLKTARKIKVVRGKAVRRTNRYNECKKCGSRFLTVESHIGPQRKRGESN